MLFLFIVIINYHFSILFTHLRCEADYIPQHKLPFKRQF